MPSKFTQEQQDQIQEKLFQKGIFLIRELGLQRTTVDKLTKACGIAKGSFYLFYASKEEYLVALEKYTSEKMMTLLKQCLACRSQMTAHEFCMFLKEWLYSDYDIMSHLTVEDFLWIQSHMAGQNYFDSLQQQAMINQWLTKISDVRKDIDTGAVVNLIKCIYAMREHRNTMVESSIDCSIDLILQTLEKYISGK